MSRQQNTVWPRPAWHGETRSNRCRAVFRALADSTWRQLLDRLRANNGQTLGELCQHADMTRQAVAKHLAVLEEANLVVTLRRGREKLHYLNPVPIHEIAERWCGAGLAWKADVVLEMDEPSCWSPPRRSSPHHVSPPWPLRDARSPLPLSVRHVFFVPGIDLEPTLKFGNVAAGNRRASRARR
jgi:DNA-binding transcriptional ArsR family regulator